MTVGSLIENGICKYIVWPDMVLHQMDLHTATTNEKYMVGKDPSSWVLTKFCTGYQLHDTNVLSYKGTGQEWYCCNGICCLIIKLFWFDENSIGIHLIYMRQKLEKVLN